MPFHTPRPAAGGHHHPRGDHRVRGPLVHVCAQDAARVGCARSLARPCRPLLLLTVLLCVHAASLGAAAALASPAPARSFTRCLMPRRAPRSAAQEGGGRGDGLGRAQPQEGRQRDDGAGAIGGRRQAAGSGERQGQTQSRSADDAGTNGGSRELLARSAHGAGHTARLTTCLPPPLPLALPSSSQVREIAAIKLPDLNCTTIEAAANTIAGTARNMGITVEA